MPSGLLRAMTGLLALALVGCGTDTLNARTWWGSMDEAETAFATGGTLALRGFAHQATVGDPARDLLEIVLVEADQSVPCTGYVYFLQRAQEVQAYVDEVLVLPEVDRPPSADWMTHVCQDLDGAARQAFGDDGAYRALHLLADVTDAESETNSFGLAPEPSVPEHQHLGAEALTAGTLVSRLYERRQHGDGILPEDDDGAWHDEDPSPILDCVERVGWLVQEHEQGDDAFPDSSSLALQAANHRYYHAPTELSSVALGDGSEVPLGLWLSDWTVAAQGSATMTLGLFNELTRTPDDCPYDDLLIAVTDDLYVESCEELTPYLGAVWPELPELAR
jgi:hypothetical protein